MDRVSTYGSHLRILSAVLAQQARVNDANWQVASGKKSQTFQGLGFDSSRLLNLQTTRTTVDRMAQMNDAMLRRLDIGNTALTSIDTSLRDFRESLMSAGGNNPLEPQNVMDLQDAAFRALSNLEAFLNTQADGRYLFSGSQVTTKPVNLGYATLDDFQARYDGVQTLYPPTRAAHLSADLTLTTADTGGLVITNANTIGTVDTSAVPSPFDQIDVGATITVDGSGLGNGGSYTVVSKPSPYELVVSGSLTLSANATVDVEATLTDGSEAAGATLSLASWYQGDELSMTHRVDEQRDETFDLNAVDPAFEKALRACGLIAQGALDTDGGLANHPERVGWAIDLLNSALERAPSQPPPFGTELPGNLDDVRRELGYQQSLLSETSQRQKDFVGQLDIQISKTSDADQNEASAQLLDSSNALQAAYSAIALVRQLSLVNFL